MIFTKQHGLYKITCITEELRGCIGYGNIGFCTKCILVQKVYLRQIMIAFDNNEGNIMLRWKLRVKDYGKISSADIEMAPMTLFVGDNNSGKSYLLSLLWGIHNLGTNQWLSMEEGLQTDELAALKSWMYEQMRMAREKKIHEVVIGEAAGLFEAVLNQILAKEKNNIVKWIFNSTDISIGYLEIVFQDVKEQVLKFEYEQKYSLLTISLDLQKFAISRDAEELFGDSSQVIWPLIVNIYRVILDSPPEGTNADMYLPSARTGFMLTKDIVNKYSRQEMFNLFAKKDPVAPFTRPINQFLDILGDLSDNAEIKLSYSKIAEKMEQEMAGGRLEINTLPGKEVLYVPNGNDKRMPLRMVSAVVTELSPFMLIMKHKQMINRFYYEEPEMCLHPQLQQKMGNILCRTIRMGIDIAMTTHSDIILQYINNMIRLCNREDSIQLCKELGYQQSDLVSDDAVKVYQLKTGSDGKTYVENLPCGRNGFVVPTFNDSLEKFLEETCEIQGE